MSKLAVGTVVELHSGGPSMTVFKDRPEEGSKFVGVAWFNGTVLAREVLPKDALKVTAEAPGKPEKSEKSE